MNKDVPNHHPVKNDRTSFCPVHTRQADFADLPSPMICKIPWINISSIQCRYGMLSIYETPNKNAKLSSRHIEFMVNQSTKNKRLLILQILVIFHSKRKDQFLYMFLTMFLPLQSVGEWSNAKLGPLMTGARGHGQCLSLFRRALTASWRDMYNSSDGLRNRGFEQVWSVRVAVGKGRGNFQILKE